MYSVHTHTHQKENLKIFKSQNVSNCTSNIAGKSHIFTFILTSLKAYGVKE